MINSALKINIYSLTTLSALLITSLSGIYGLKANPKSSINRSFALFMLSVSLYLFSEMENLSSLNTPYNLFWARMSYVLVFFVATNFVYFTLVFPRRHKLMDRNLLPFLLYIPTLAFTLFLFDKSLVISVQYNNGIRIFNYGYLFPFFFVYLLGFFAFGAINLIQNYMQAKSVLEKVQIGYVLTGILMGGVLGLLINSLLPAFAIPITSLASLTLIILAGFTTYALIREKPLDIEVILKKSLLYYLLIAIVIGTYFLVVKNLGDLLGRMIGSTSVVVESLLIVAIAFIFKPLADSLENFIDRWLFRRRMDYGKVLSEFSESLVYYINLSRLTQLIIQRINEILQIEKIIFWIINEKKTGYDIAEILGLKFEEISTDININQNKNFLEFICSHPKVWNVNQLINILKTDEQIYKIMEEMKVKGISLCIPLVTRGELLGILALGEKLTGTTFSEDEIRLLFTLSNQAAIALENALVYEEMKKTYQRLSQTEKLAALGELSAGLAHEIRNPLSNIKGSAEILKNSTYNLGKEEQFVDYIIEEVERLNNLLTNFLAFARPPEPGLRKINLNKLWDEVIFFFQPQLTEAKVIVHKDLWPELPEVNIDSEQWRQVCTNLILNSLQAMPEGGELKIKTTVHSRENDKSFVEIEVADTGVGIAEEDIDKIFNPFYTTREDGVGLGLAIVHRIVKMHGGEIMVESRKNRGTKFTIRLPGD